MDLLVVVTPVTAYPLVRGSTYSSVRTIIEAPAGVLAHTVRWARSPLARARGLLGAVPLSQGEALILVGARQVHTFGLRYRIDVLFCDREWKVVHVERDLAPARVSRWVRGADTVIEARAGAFDAVRPGETISVRSG